MMRGEQQPRLIHVIAVAAFGWTAQRVVVEEVVRHHFEATPVNQGYACTAAAAHLVVGVRRFMVCRSEIPQHNTIARSAQRLVVQVRQQIAVGVVPGVKPIVRAGTCAIFAWIVVSEILVVLGKGFLEMASTHSIVGIELIPDQVTVVVGLGLTLHG